MGQPTKIISISRRVFLPELEDILEKAKSKQFAYEFVPVVTYSEKEQGNPEIRNEEPVFLGTFLSLFENKVLIESLIRYIGDIEKKELSLAKVAFAKLKNFALQCAERVSADLCYQVVLETNKKYRAHDLIIYFIEKSASDKILGRLGHLYLDLTNVIICFISYEPEDMITTVMSAKTGRLLFDIHRLMSDKTDDDIRYGPHPGSSEDSLIQAYFFRPRSVSPGSAFLPIRFDIFCQGLLEPDLQKKADIIRGILRDEQESQAYAIKKEDPSPYVKLPIGLQAVIRSWDEPTRQKKFFFDRLNELSKGECR